LPGDADPVSIHSVRSTKPKRRVPIATRFWAVLVVLLAAMGLMGWFGFNGLANMNASAGHLGRAAAQNARDTAVRARIIDLRSALQLSVARRDPSTEEQTHATVEYALVQLDVDLNLERSLAGDDYAGTQRRRLAQISEAWRRGSLTTAASGPAAERLEADGARRVTTLLAPMLQAADARIAADERSATAAKAASDRTYQRTDSIMAVVFSLTFVLAIALNLWLIRAVVPRTRRYTLFAARVSTGAAAGRLDPRGNDELADLGRSLDAMVARHESERAERRAQDAFVDAVQVSDSEDEAHELIRRHLERSIPESTVVVLNRNNSDDRLEVRTPVPADSALAAGLDGASPRSCLAVRLGRSHEGGLERDALLSCEVCGRVPNLTTCSPLYVGGEVMGSLLINHPEALDPQQESRVHDSVIQAAPVLVNLRNLAIAELRASTDALTGLPNRRAVHDTLKRMGAQAMRAEAPLGALLLDLDHFKRINDTFGHGLGDDALAAVAETMRTALRESDFLGRYGGEEFLVLLPGTGLAGSQEVAEKLRVAVNGVLLPAIDRELTVSIGIAVMPEDGSDTDSLIRNADRALYSAKANGRNRVELNAIARPDAAVA
jgi:diguanylate cyclase (GGDEF)-like protein